MTPPAAVPGPRTDPGAGLEPHGPVQDTMLRALGILRFVVLLNAIGIYPEGTRSPDGRLFRGKIGVARMALETGAPVVPVAMVYRRRRLPFGLRVTTVDVRFGEPLDFSRYEGLSGDRFVERSITDEIMYEIMELSGQEYVDVYGATVKKSMDATGASAVEVLRRMQSPADEAGDRPPTALAG